jgi:hypothetical protein
MGMKQNPLYINQPIRGPVVTASQQRFGVEGKQEVLHSVTLFMFVWYVILSQLNNLK